jgi:colicin import membrane protein
MADAANLSEALAAATAIEKQFRPLLKLPEILKAAASLESRTKELDALLKKEQAQLADARGEQAKAADAAKKAKADAAAECAKLKAECDVACAAREEKSAAAVRKAEDALSAARAKGEQELAAINDKKAAAVKAVESAELELASLRNRIEALRKNVAAL